ncbi:putative serine/threonine-protein kinase PrkC [Ruminococcus sp. CAG:563]|nr:putative serine/threonine-protein kinase PrkC [Ruminococcus sp. CAG:563]HJI47202.1 Stk1 family PASTA domain-containing Ser/Thr kinase [Oscillospiraceae bacterium]
MENYVGKRLDGRYEIQEIIGVGGMAVVYKAYDNIDDRIVAVKILKEEFLANEEFRRRFKNESKAIAVLSHPNIVKVYDVSYGDRIQYIVMECVDGITLKEYIQQQGVINYKEAVFFVTQILRALQHAHDKGIVHRDIKPQNIMLLENGAIKVTDFGIARFSRSETRTMTDSTIGSVHYISPEQARGDITDDKADIYSVGVMLYEMLTGKLPFESDNTVSVAIMQLQQDPVKPRDINPSIPVGLEQIVLKAMQKNVNDRYQSAAEMLLDLEEFRRNPSIQFDYDYKNTEPTKYIPNITGSIKHIDPVEVEDDEEEEPVVKNRTIPILVGVITALVVVLAVAFGVLFKMGYLTGNSKVKVPNFVGIIYDEEEFKNKYPNYVFDVTEKVDADVSPNEIISQTPEKGTKIDPKKTKIELVIATNAELVEVPDDLIGTDYVTAVTRLNGLGFKIKEKEVEQKDYPGIPAGTVVSINPKGGNKVSVGTSVTLEYVSYDETKEKLVIVPDVSNLDEENAKKVLTSSGFTVSTKSEYSDTVTKGYVISNTFKGSKIPSGSNVVITVSKGKLIEQSTNISVTLPKYNGQGNVTATLDDTTVFTGTCTLDGSNVEVTVRGYEATSVFKFFVDGKLIYKCNVNFTSSPVSLSNETTYEYVGVTTTFEPVLYTIPNVVGDTYAVAMAKLRAAGFKNIISEGPISGTVVKIEPASGVSVSPDVQIKITFGGGSEN